MRAHPIWTIVHLHEIRSTLKIIPMKRWYLFLLVGIVLFAAGFGSGVVLDDQIFSTPTPTRTSTATPTETITPSATNSPTASFTPSLTPTKTLTPSITPSPTITLTPSQTPTPSNTPTITPTQVVQARVLVQSNCRYGPGSAYLYEWGLFPKNRVTVLGRNQDGTWVYVDPWTYIDYCWVKTEFLEILSGDVESLVQIRTLLPYTEFYLAPRNVSSSRVESGDIMVNWDLVPMSLDDDRGYLIEAWLCQDGQLRFTPLHFWNPPAFLHDEPGCLEPSSARIYTAEKHGYTTWVLINIPPYLTPTPTPEPSEKP
jgi:hypothetical protein